jgi:hypothetical protein
MAVHLRLYVDGVLVPGSYVGTPDDPSTAFAEGTLTITWGRDTTTDQPAAGSCTFTIVRPAVVDWLRVGAMVRVMTAGVGREDACVFLGSITSMTMTWSDEHGCPAVAVIADDVLADLGNRRVAATPWPKETLAARVDHVMQASRQDVWVTVATTIQGGMVAKQDVDVRMAADVLQQLSASFDSALWSTVRRIGAAPNPIIYLPSLWLENPGDRPALRRLAKPAALIVIVFDAAAVAAVAMTLDPCVFDREPLQLDEAVDDVVTGVSVTYLSPDPTDGTKPDLSLTADIVNSAAENPSGGWGVRRISVDSLLTNYTDASALGDRILGRLRTLTWRASSLSFDQADTPAITDAQVAQLLDINQRNGQAVIVPLPDWAPSDELIGYVEGGTYTYALGSWSLDLAISEASAYGASDTVWNDMPDDPAWIWNNWDPDIAWDDLAGVGPPIGV